MHLEGPWLSTTGKQKTKRRWASAEQKLQHDELAASWASLKSKYEPRTTIGPAKKSRGYVPPVNPRVAELRAAPSVDSGIGGAVTIRQPQQYTGTKIIGIGTMHKSNAVPI
jgi:hypothetical protein